MAEEKEKLILKCFTVSIFGKEKFKEIRERERSDLSLFFQEFLDAHHNDPIAILDKCYEPIIDKMSYSTLNKIDCKKITTSINKDTNLLLEGYKQNNGIPMVRIFLAMVNYFYNKLPKGANISKTKSLTQEGNTLFLTQNIADKLVAIGNKHGYYPSTILKIGLTNLKSSSLPKIEDDKTSKIGGNNFERLIRISPPIYQELVKLYKKNKVKNYSRVNITEILINSAETYLEKLI